MANDLWRTPKQVFNHLNKEFNFIVDLACTEENKLCYLGFTEEMDSLSLDWAKEVYKRHPFKTSLTGFLNCPYSDPKKWVEKSIEAQLNGLGVVMLLNADCSVGWFKKAIDYVSEIRFITGGRLAFLDAEGKPKNGNSKGQMILIFNPYAIGQCVTRYIDKGVFYGL